MRGGFPPTRYSCGHKPSIFGAFPMRRLPFNVHVMRGNPSKRRHPRGIAPEAPPTVPDPPSFLAPLAAGEWRRIAPELHRLGLLTALDITPLAAYCQAFAVWCDAARAFADGRTHEERTLLSRISREAGSDMVRYSKQFGMTPSSRSAVSAAVSDRPGKFDDLIG
jgi:P27 family predicted phage terminase small subunit